MAGVDKIYGTYEQYFELKEWLEINSPEFIRYLYTPPCACEHDAVPIINLPSEADAFMYKNCPLKFVISAIEFQYNIAPTNKE